MHQTPETEKKTRRSEAGSLWGQYPPLDSEVRPAVPTEQAAFYLSRRPQTLRVWAMREDGPIRPVRVNGRLLWPVAEIKRVLGAQS